MLVAYRRSRRESLRLLCLGSVAVLAAGCSFPAALAVHSGSSPDRSTGGLGGLISGPSPTATPTAIPTATPTVATTVVPSPTPGPVTLLVGKTDGDGVYIRSSIKPEKKVKVWPDRTKMVVVGPDQTVDNRTWKNVRDPAGNVGWVPAQYLVPDPAAPKATATPSARAAATGTPLAAPGAAPARWNTTELDAFASGNIPQAAEQLRALGTAEVKGRAQKLQPAAVLQSLPRYFGTIVRLEGYVGQVQPAPADSAITRLLGLGVVHLLVSCQDGTVVDAFQLGPSGDARIGDLVAVYGLPAGQSKVDNRLTGASTHLVLVTRLIERMPQ